jgi:predicted permease
MLNDVRYALRMLRRSPSFSAVAILVLALGIGANAAMFSVIHAVLLQSLPYEKPDKLVILWMRFTGIGIPKDQNWVSAPEFMDLRSTSKAFSEIAAISSNSYNIQVGKKPERILGAAVSASFFRLLGVPPVLGRSFLAEEETPGLDGAIIISYGLWQRRFGADPGIQGRPLSVNGRSFQIIGVMPKGFGYPDQAEIWTPLAFTADDLAPTSRGDHGLLAIARIRDDISLAAANADMERVSQRIIDGTPDYPYKRFGFRVIMTPLLEDMIGDLRPSLLILMGSVAFVLLIACSNVANLLLAKASSRERELAVRNALGASRSRLIRQLLTESAVMSIAGALAGMAMAKWALMALTRVAETAMPRITQAELNWPVLGFTTSIAILTAVVFGLWPALRSSAGFNPESLKEAGRPVTSGTARQRLRDALVVAEVALSLVLLAGAGLLVRSFMRLEKIDPGFRPHNVLTMRITLPDARYSDPGKINAFYRELARRVAALPGVEAAGAIGLLPLSGQNSSGTVTVDTQAVPAENRTPEADRRPVMPGLFQALGIELLRGRFFDERDSENSAPVAIVDETMVRAYWPNENPIGKRIKQGGEQSKSPWMTIVGVVRQVRYRTLEAPSRVQLYWPEVQNPWHTLGLAIRTAIEPHALADIVEQQVLAIDPDQPVYMIRTMDELTSNSMAQRRLSMWLLSGFAGIAMLLAAAGVYGVISYSVAQRTRELGIRMALGASHWQVLRMVLQHSLGLVVTGVAIGIAGSLFLTRFMSGMLFNVSATDPFTLAAVALTLACIGLIAGYLPARRATHIEPVEALRQE